MMTMKRRTGRGAGLLGITASVALTALLAMNLGCASAPKNPNGLAGSTDILKFMNNWRGVWTGSVRESPIGPLSYTLYIEERPDMLYLRMADEGARALSEVRNEFAFLNFDRGTPRIRVLLTMRGRTTVQNLVYEPARSSDSSAAFCLEDKGCVFTELVFTRIGKLRVAIHAKVEEAKFADIEVRFLDSQIPKSGVEKERARLTSERDESSDDGTIEVEVEAR